MLNIVLSKNKDLKIKNAIVVNSVEEVLKKIQELSCQGYTSDDVFVIGGESIYRKTRKWKNYCNQAYITKIYHQYEADAYFPDLDESKEWRRVEQSEEQTYFDIEYTFLKYRRVKII